MYTRLFVKLVTSVENTAAAGFQQLGNKIRTNPFSSSILLSAKLMSIATLCKPVVRGAAAAWPGPGRRRLVVFPAFSPPVRCRHLLLTPPVRCCHLLLTPPVRCGRTWSARRHLQTVNTACEEQPCPPPRYTHKAGRLHYKYRQIVAHSCILLKLMEGHQN